jgi:arginine decarboxylase
MIERTTRTLARRVLIVDDQLGQATSAGGRSVRALAEELRATGIDVVEALSCEDGLATVVSDSAIHCAFVNWTLGRNDSKSHAQATDLLRKGRNCCSRHGWRAHGLHNTHCRP